VDVRRNAISRRTVPIANAEKITAMNLSKRTFPNCIEVSQWAKASQVFTWGMLPACLIKQLEVYVVYRKLEAYATNILADRIPPTAYFKRI